MALPSSWVVDGKDTELQTGNLVIFGMVWQYIWLKCDKLSHAISWKAILMPIHPPASGEVFEMFGYVVCICCLFLVAFSQVLCERRCSVKH